MKSPALTTMRKLVLIMKSLIGPLFIYVVVAQSAVGHHSFRGVYDFNARATINGVFVSLDLVNPHARLYIDVINDSGKNQRWVIEAPGKLSLARRGWTDAMFVGGDMLQIVGHPSLAPSQSMWLEKIITADGTEYVDPLVEDQLAIEEERRQRAQATEKI